MQVVTIAIKVGRIDQGSIIVLYAQTLKAITNLATEMMTSSNLSPMTKDQKKTFLCGSSMTDALNEKNQWK